MNNERIWKILVPERPYSAAQSILIGAGATALAILIRMPFELWLSGLYPFATFFPAVLLATVTGGRPAGIFAVAAGGVIGLAVFGSEAYIGGAAIWVFAGGVLYWAGWTIRKLIIQGRKTSVELKAANERQQLLLREFEHRTRNSFSVIDALFQQTVRNARSIDDVSARFPQRLGALAESKRMLIEGFGKPVRLQDIVSAALKPFAESAGRQFRIDGPDDVLVHPDCCTPLMLALHELATNASKYGALTAPGGRVACEWRRCGEQCELSWRERGGPAVTAPAKRGAGAFLIENAMSHMDCGGGELRFEPEGVVCLLRFPPAAVPSSPDAAAETAAVKPPPACAVPRTAA